MIDLLGNGKPDAGAGSGTAGELRRVRCALPPEGRLLHYGEGEVKLVERFRFIEHSLRRLRRTRHLQRVLVTSPAPKDGKTVVALNLAITLARSAGSVLLVDADLRSPGVHRAIGVEALPGLADVLEERQTLAGTLVSLDPLNVLYLPAGEAQANPVELFQGVRMRQLFEEELGRFDWVVVDSPPLIPVADAHWLAGLVDAVLLVARAGATSTEDLERALADLRGVFLAGVVLNACDDRRRDSYYSHYGKGDAVRSTRTTG